MILPELETEVLVINNFLGSHEEEDNIEAEACV